MRHSVSNHDLFSSKVEQGKHYVCDGRDLIKPTPEQYERYKDGSHGSKKKPEENEKSEAKRKRVEVRTKGGKKAKKEEVASISREVDLAELMRRREEQVAIQNAGKVDAKKREELIEQERATAEKKIQLEEQHRNNAEKNRKIKEERQKNLRLVEEQKKEDKIQFEKSLTKTLALERGRSETVVIKKGGRKEMTSVELDAKLKELNAAQMRVNTRAAVDQIVGARVTERKETQKSGVPGFKMMRAEEESGEGGRLPPVTEILNTRSRSAGAVKNVKAIIKKKGKKIVSVPAPIIEEMELKGEKVEVDFEREQVNAGWAEISQEILNVVARTMQGGHEGDEIEPMETLSTTFLQSLVSDRMDIDLGQEYEERVQEAVHDLEESGGRHK